jgi:hypothetical protein
MPGPLLLRKTTHSRIGCLRALGEDSSPILDDKHAPASFVPSSRDFYLKKLLPPVCGRHMPAIEKRLHPRQLNRLNLHNLQILALTC